MAAPLAQRQAYILMRPHPRSIIESSAVLSALSTRFGPVSHFESLKYFPSSSSFRPDAAFAIFESEKSFQKARDASPLNVRIPTDPETGNGEERVLTCEVYASKVDHVKRIRASPYHGPWKVEKSSLPFKDLSQSPVSGAYADCSLKDRQGLRPTDRLRLLEEVRLPEGGLMGWYRAGPGKKGTIDEDITRAGTEPLPTSAASMEQGKAGEEALAFEKGSSEWSAGRIPRKRSYKTTTTRQARDEGGFFTPQEESRRQEDTKERKLRSLRERAFGWGK